MKKGKLIASVFTLSMLVACTASANVIAYNFTGDWAGPRIQGDGMVDGTDVWTDSVDPAGPNGTNPANSTDDWTVTTPINAPGVSVAWSSANLWSGGSQDTPDQALYRMYLDDGGAGPTITISGLSAWLIDNNATGYKIDVYRASKNAANGFAEVNIYSGAGTGGTQLETIAYTSETFGGDYPVANEGGEGDRLKQTATGTFVSDVVTLHSDWNLSGQSGRGSIAAFKLTAIPEPSTLGLVTAFSGAVLFIRRRFMI